MSYNSLYMSSMVIYMSGSTLYNDVEVMCSEQSAGSICMEGAVRTEAPASNAEAQHLTQKQLAERLGMNPRTIIDLETCQSNPKFETVVLVAKELNISVDAAIFPEMVNQTVSKTVVDFFAGKSEAEIEKFIALCKQAEAFQKDE